VDQSVFDHQGPWTEAAYLDLPRNERVEVVEGTLLIGPGANAEHAAAVDWVRDSIVAALPDGLTVRGPVSLRLGPDCVLVPDLIVTAAEAGSDEGGDDDGDDGDDRDDRDAGKVQDDEGGSAGDGEEVLDASAALMVIEVVGREHGAVDRTFKPQLYAGCRIPYLLLIDHHGPFAVAEMIISGRYHEYARAAGDEPLRIEEPFGFELDLRGAARLEEQAGAVG
jgi:hypothetical protein